MQFTRTDKVKEEARNGGTEMQNKKGRYVDVVNEQGYLKIVFLPSSLCLAMIKCSRRASAYDNSKLIEALVKAYEVYMAEVYDL